MTGQEILFLLAMLILVFISMLVVPGWMVKRNISKVIEIFEITGAIGIENAVTLEELGLVPKTQLQRMFRLRDWKPKALDLLVQANVVLMTEDGKLYITEESLENNPWLKQKK